MLEVSLLGLALVVLVGNFAFVLWLRAPLCVWLSMLVGGCADAWFLARAVSVLV